MATTTVLSSDALQSVAQCLGPREITQFPDRSLSAASRGAALLYVYRRGLTNAQQLLHTQTWTPRKIWETVLTREGLVPPRVPRGAVVGHRFLEVKSDSFALRKTPSYRFVEWDACDLAVTRWYWQLVLDRVEPCIRTQLDHLCQELVTLLLPGVRQRCLQCQWSIPHTEMHTDECCTFCHQRQQQQHEGTQATFAMMRRVPYVKVQHGVARIEAAMNQLKL